MGMNGSGFHGFQLRLTLVPHTTFPYEYILRLGVTQPPKAEKPEKLAEPSSAPYHRGRLETSGQ